MGLREIRDPITGAFLPGSLASSRLPRWSFTFFECFMWIILSFVLVFTFSNWSLHAWSFISTTQIAYKDRQFARAFLSICFFLIFTFLAWSAIFVCLILLSYGDFTSGWVPLDIIHDPDTLKLIMVIFFSVCIIPSILSGIVAIYKLVSDAVVEVRLNRARRRYENLANSVSTDQQLCAQPTASGKINNLIATLSPNVSFVLQKPDPDVAILIPVYHEPLPNLLATINAIAQSRYTRARLHVFIGFDDYNVEKTMFTLRRLMTGEDVLLGDDLDHHHKVNRETDDYHDQFDLVQPRLEPYPSRPSRSTTYLDSNSPELRNNSPHTSLAIPSSLTPPTTPFINFSKTYNADSSNKKLATPPGTPVMSNNMKKSTKYNGIQQLSRMSSWHQQNTNEPKQPIPSVTLQRAQRRTLLSDSVNATPPYSSNNDSGANLYLPDVSCPDGFEINYQGVHFEIHRFEHGGKLHTQKNLLELVTQHIDSGRIDPRCFCLFIDSDTTIIEDTVRQFVDQFALDEYKTCIKQGVPIPDHSSSSSITTVANDYTESPSITNFSPDIPHRLIACTGFIVSRNGHGYNLFQQYQDAEYIFMQATVRAMESVFGAVTCLPGALTMIRYPAMYSLSKVYFHQSAIEGNFEFCRRSLGEDRFLTQLAMEQYGRGSIGFASGAICKTEAPGSFYNLMRQRRRWYLGAITNEVYMMSTPSFLLKFPLILLVRIFSYVRQAGMIFYIIMVETILRGIFLPNGVSYFDLVLIIAGPVFLWCIIIGWAVFRGRWKTMWMFLFYITCNQILEVVYCLYSLWTVNEKSWGGPRAEAEEKEIPLNPVPTIQDSHITTTDVTTPLLHQTQSTLHAQQHTYQSSIGQVNSTYLSSQLNVFDPNTHLVAHGFQRQPQFQPFNSRTSSPSSPAGSLLRQHQTQ